MLFFLLGFCLAEVEEHFAYFFFFFSFDSASLGGIVVGGREKNLRIVVASWFFLLERMSCLGTSWLGGAGFNESWAFGRLLLKELYEEFVHF